MTTTTARWRVTCVACKVDSTAEDDAGLLTLLADHAAGAARAWDRYENDEYRRDRPRRERPDCRGGARVSPVPTPGPKAVMA